MKVTIKIQVCPFCGHEAEFGVDSAGSHRIQCIDYDCKAKMIASYPHYFDPKGMGMTLEEYSYTKLVLRWNMRVPQDEEQ